MLGSLISAGASIAGGLLGSNSAEKQAKANAAMQMRFAKNQLQWRAEDAEKAGISKVFAMGAPTMSFTPSSVGGTDLGIAAAGQDIGRAIDAGMSPGGKSNALMQSVLLEGAQLDNDIKRTEIASKIATLRQAGSPPGVPNSATLPTVPGQGNAVQLDGPTLKLQTRRDIADPNAPSNIPGESPGTAFYRNPQGGLTVFIPPEMAESFEQDNLGGVEWQLRNRILPWINNTQSGPSRAGLLPWQEYYFDRSRGDWRIRDRPGGRFNTR